MGRDREYHCGTCTHRTHKYWNFILEKGDCNMNLHSGKTTDGYKKVKEYKKLTYNKEQNNSL